MLEFDEYRLTLENMQGDIEELKESLDIAGTNAQIEKLEKQSADPAFWDNMEESQKILQKIKQLKNKVEQYDQLYTSWEDLVTLVELGNEEEDLSVLEEVKSGLKELQNNVETMTLQTLLSGEYDANNAILTLHAGAGGTEAQDWCEMLYRMYSRWAEKAGYAVTVLDFLEGDEAGIKSITFQVSGLNAYGYCRAEKGVHRLVRISPFDSSGRRHTSFASLEVMPEIEDDTSIEIAADEIRIDTYRASGAGGQHINKTDSAIRITHFPTGIVVSCQNERSQHKNKDMAMKMLKSKLVELKEQEQQAKIEGIKGEQKDIAWGSQIRSYVFHPYNLVKDHRTSFEMGNIGAVMDGDLDGFINAYLKMSAQKN